jgi:nucleotide-binding universal stress UspA family protein
MRSGSYPFSRILIPYDGSSPAKPALKWAGHLARAGGADVELVTLLQVAGGGYLARHVHNVDLRVSRLDQVEAWQRVRRHYLDQEILPLLEEGKRFLQEKGVAAPIETQVAEGKIGDEIIRLAREGGYNAMVMGRRGLSPVKGFFLGSVTRQVLSLAEQTTVFVVGQEVVFNPDCPFSPLLIPVDGSEPGLAAVRQAAALARSCKKGGPQLTLLHVIDLALLGIAYEEGAAFLLEEGEKTLATGRQILQQAGLQDLATEKLLTGSPSQMITQETEAGHYSLIMMGARGLSALKQLLLGSVSSDVLHRAAQAIVGVVYL